MNSDNAIDSVSPASGDASGTDSEPAKVGDGATFDGTFADLGVSEGIMAGLTSMGYERPTEV